MKILLCSHVFAPSIGGIETVSAILAEQFCRLGLHVKVVTNTPGGQGNQGNQGYEIVRQPSIKELRKLGREADLIFQNNISLKTLLPLLTCGKPIVINHNGPLTRLDGSRGWQDYAKIALLPLCRNVVISSAIGASIPARSTVIGNPYETSEFAGLSDTPRTRDLVFLGRLVSQKGCDLLLRSLAILKDQGVRPSLTVIGDGSELPALRQMTSKFDLASQVRFLGAMREGRGSEVARHRIMVVPSMYAEPFGVVALEGISAGCVIVASSAGGLPEAVGPCGVLFPNGDANALATAIRDLLSNPGRIEELRMRSAKHLEQFQPELVAGKYLEVFEAATRGHP
jgi:glycosyltransferase involved in cell wall biosynthesis